MAYLADITICPKYDLSKYAMRLTICILDMYSCGERSDLQVCMIALSAGCPEVKANVRNVTDFIKAAIKQICLKIQGFFFINISRHF